MQGIKWLSTCGTVIMRRSGWICSSFGAPFSPCAEGIESMLTQSRLPDALSVLAQSRTLPNRLTAIWLNRLGCCDAQLSEGFSSDGLRRCDGTGEHLSC